MRKLHSFCLFEHQKPHNSNLFIVHSLEHILFILLLGGKSVTLADFSVFKKAYSTGIVGIPSVASFKFILLHHISSAYCIGCTAEITTLTSYTIPCSPSFFFFWLHRSLFALIVRGCLEQVQRHVLQEIYLCLFNPLLFVIWTRLQDNQRSYYFHFHFY